MVDLNALVAKAIEAIVFCYCSESMLVVRVGAA